jgi:hypothetical protein
MGLERDRKMPPAVVWLPADVVTNVMAPVARRITARMVRPAREEPAPDLTALALPPAGTPLHFTRMMSELCADGCRALPEFRHIDMARVLVTFVAARKNQPWGLQAKVTPLRFRGGALVARRRGHAYRIQQFHVGELQMRYVLSFCLPRFLNQNFREKIATVFHELYHIAPDFGGDVRRFGPSKTRVHACSHREYDRQMLAFADQYLATVPDPALFDFLRLNFAQLAARHGSLVGVHVPAPKLLPIAAP